MENKIGIGYDIHCLVEGRQLFLGAVEIPYVKGLLGHSDADVLLHAICDALLGAIGAGDIGEHFPDSDPKYRGIASRELLHASMKLVEDAGFTIVNIDSVIVAQEPNLTPFKKQIRAQVAGILKIKEDLVNIKAKTNEGIGPIGGKEAIACYAAVLLSREVKR